MHRMMEFALMGFGKRQMTVQSPSATHATRHFIEMRGGRPIPRGWWIQFQREIPVCPTCGQVIHP